MNWIHNNWLKGAAVLLLCGAIAPVPYFAYYQLMNWVVVGAAVMTAWQALDQGSRWAFWLFAFVAVVFNPLAPFYFSTVVWQYADVVAAVLFLLSFTFIRTKN